MVATNERFAASARALPIGNYYLLQDLLYRVAALTDSSWNLDSQGNWSSSTTNGTTQTQTANAQNQITSISGTAGTPTYDANGNMTTDQNGDTYTYNAWNQLVGVKNSTGQIIAQYTYNAMGYRITEAYPQGGTGIPAGEVNYIYYNSNWQAIETRTNGTAAGDVASQMVWSAAYINAAVLQDTYSAGAAQPNSRIYFLQDADWNTTAIVGVVGGNWQVVQRYVYSQYGTITVLNGDWSTPPTGTQPSVSNLYQGMTLDSVTGLYDERFRNYSPELGTWISQDPAGYINGANTYQYVQSSPVARLDPNGTQVFATPWGSLVPATQLSRTATIKIQEQGATAEADRRATGAVENWLMKGEQAVDKFMRGSATLLHTAYEIWKKLSRRCRGRDGEDVPIEE